jgi:hypothetical protein
MREERVERRENGEEERVAAIVAGACYRDDAGFSNLRDRCDE